MEGVAKENKRPRPCMRFTVFFMTVSPDNKLFKKKKEWCRAFGIMPRNAEPSSVPVALLTKEGIKTLRCLSFMTSTKEAPIIAPMLASKVNKRIHIISGIRTSLSQYLLFPHL
jgi:hypothetical protein